MWGFISSVVSAAASFVSGAIASVGGALGSALSTGLGFLMNRGLGILSTVANIVTGVMKALNLFEPQDKPEEMGERILQASEAGITRESCDSFDEYIAKLRAFEINPDKQHKPEEQLLATVGVSAMGISESKDLPIDSVMRLTALAAISPGYFNTERFVQMVGLGAPLLDKVLKYFGNQLDSGGMEKVETTLTDLEKAHDPTRSDEQILAEIDATASAVRKEIDA